MGEQLTLPSQLDDALSDGTVTGVMLLGGLYAYVLFMTKSPYTGNGNGGEFLGGVGMSAGMSFNW